MGQETQWDKNRELRMTQAVDAARALFLSRGIDNVRMTEIAQKAGLGVASLYRYFATKDAIAIAVGELLWKELNGQFRSYFASPEFGQKTGIGQVRGMLDFYTSLLASHREFLLFLSDFDSYCLKEGIPKESLAGYEREIADFYRLYEQVLRKGQADGTIRLEADPELLYLTVSHTMLSFLTKLAQGGILEQDQHGPEELELLKEIILQYLRTREGA